MKKLIFIILLFIALQQVFPQKKPSVKDLPVISNAQVKFIKVNRTVAGQTSSIPPGYKYKTEGYDFAVKFDIALNNIKSHLRPYSIVIFMPDSAVKEIKLTWRNLRFSSGKKAICSFHLETKKTGRAEIILVDSNEIKAQTEAKLYKKKSNKLIVYFEVPK